MFVFFAAAAVIPQVRWHEINVDGRQRRYMVERTEGHRKAGSAVLLIWHGFGDSAESMRGWSGFSAAAKGKNVILAYPDGLPNAEGKRNHQVGYAFQDSSIDDVKFAKMIVDDLQKKYGANSARVFSTGMSNGGDMCYLLARQAKPIVRAVAPIAGCMMSVWDQSLRTPPQVPILAANGNADETTRWAGDMANRDGWGPYLSQEAVARFWTLGLDPVENRVVGNRPRVRVQRWRSDETDREFVHYKVIGGGHTWPERLVNPRKTLAEEILDFFERYR